MTPRFVALGLFYFCIYFCIGCIFWFGWPYAELGGLGMAVVMYLVLAASFDRWNPRRWK